MTTANQSPIVGGSHLADTIQARHADTRAITEIYRLPPPDTDPDDVSFTPPPATVPPRAGDRIGHYVLQDLLGSGGSCFVHGGWDEANGRPVALKILNWATVCDRVAALKQMRTEAAALARVKHSHVVRFLD